MDHLAVIVVREHRVLGRAPEPVARVADPVVAGLAARIAVAQAAERAAAWAHSGDPLAKVAAADAQRLARELRPLLATPRDGAEATHSAARVAKVINIDATELTALHGYGLQSAGWHERDYDAARVYSAEDAVAAAIAHRLIARGIQPRRAVEVAEDNRPYYAEPKYWLAVRPPAQWRGASKPEALSGTGGAIILAIHEMAAEVRRELADAL